MALREVDMSGRLVSARLLSEQTSPAVCRRLLHRLDLAAFVHQGFLCRLILVDLVDEIDLMMRA